MPRQPRTIKPKQRKATTARRHISSPVNLQKQIDQRTRELIEAQKHLAELVEQQTATSEVLRVISARKANSNQYSGPRWKRRFVFARRSLETSIDGMVPL